MQAKELVARPAVSKEHPDREQQRLRPPPLNRHERRRRAVLARRKGNG